MKLSIITVNRNNEKGLLQTINSIVCQKDNNFEWLVIDGDSTDNSIKLICEYEEQIDYWVSEKDYGVYDAMNKGIRKAKGDYILFLNSGDFFYNSSATSTINNLALNSDFIIFDFFKKTNNGLEEINQNFLPKEHLINGMFCHQSILHKRSLFEQIGEYDTKYKIAADYAFLFRGFFLKNSSYSYINSAIVTYDDTDGISFYNEQTEQIYRSERALAMKAVFPKELVDELIRRELLINEMKKVKQAYDGLLKSKLIQIALKMVILKQKVFKVRVKQ